MACINGKEIELEKVYLSVLDGRINTVVFFWDCMRRNYYLVANNAFTGDSYTFPDNVSGFDDIVDGLVDPETMEPVRILKRYQIGKYYYCQEANGIVKLESIDYSYGGSPYLVYTSEDSDGTWVSKLEVISQDMIGEVG